MFWEAGDDARPGLEEWIASYNAGVSSLVGDWVGEMSRSGHVLGLPPFIGIMRSLLAQSPSPLRCGSGVDFFSIMPDGRISACPVSVDFDFSIVGSIFKGTPESLRGKATLGEPCTSCEVVGLCGGRCLFVNRSQDMLRRGGYPLICSTVNHLVSELTRALPRVQAMIRQGSLSGLEFDYPSINNGCEIVP
jgi:uncharacterized protein